MIHFVTPSFKHFSWWRYFDLVAPSVFPTPLVAVFGFSLSLSFSSFLPALLFVCVWNEVNLKSVLGFVSAPFVKPDKGFEGPVPKLNSPGPPVAELAAPNPPKPLKAPPDPLSPPVPYRKVKYLRI